MYANEFKTKEKQKLTATYTSRGLKSVLRLILGKEAKLSGRSSVSIRVKQGQGLKASAAHL